MASQRQPEAEQMREERVIMPHLYEIAGQYAFLANLEEEGDFDEALSQLGSSFSSKAQAIMQIVVTLEGQASNFRVEADRIAGKAKTMENRAAWLKDYLRRCMEAAEIDKIGAGTFTLSLQASPPKCEVVEPGLVPEAFRVVVPATWRVDAQAIIKHFKETSEQITGAVVSVSRHLRVR